MKKESKVAASIDLGSDKILCLIASITDDSIVVKGVGHQKSLGISSGIVTDIKAAQRSIISTVSTAERAAGFNIKKVVVNLGGKYLTSSFLSAETEIYDRVKKEHLSLVAENIILEYRKNGLEILHLVPIEYVLDGHTKIENPIGIAGNNLLVKFHIVSYPITQIKNIETCLKKYQLTVKNYISSPYASALACLTDNEKRIGTLLIDIGAQETSFCIYYNNKFMYNGSVALGGYNITKDISSVLDIDLQTAEKVKTLNVNFSLNDIEEDEIIKISIEDDESYKASQSKIRLVNDISKCRVEEIVKIVFQVISKKRLRDKINKIVLTGGTAIIPGIEGFIEDSINIPTRLGSIKKDVVVEGINNNVFRSTIYSSAIGMLIFVKNLFKKSKFNDFKSEGRGVTKVVVKVFKWFIS
jgi:cell division protein FtsA